MALIGIIGEDFVFQARFLDATNTPIAVPDATIAIFRLDQATGDLVSLTPSTLMDPAVPAEVGRYTYVFTVPSTLVDSTAVYAEMSGTDLGSGDPVRLTEELVARIDPASISLGLTTRFF